MGDHLRQSRPSMATKSAMDGPAGLVMAGDHLRYECTCQAKKAVESSFTLSIAFLVHSSGTVQSTVWIYKITKIMPIKADHVICSSLNGDKNRCVDDESVKTEIDTGSAVFIISESFFSFVFGTTNLQKTETKLCSYLGKQLTVKGKVAYAISYKGQTFTLPLIVLAGEGPTLLGRDWMQQISLDWPTIF